jgi:hypothetical protein
MIIFNRTLRDGLPLPDTLIHGVPGTAIIRICARRTREGIEGAGGNTEASVLWKSATGTAA